MLLAFMAVAVFAMAVVVMVIMLMLMLVFMLMMMLMLMLMLMLVVVAFDFAHPGGRCGDFFEVEHAGVDNLVEFNLAVVGFNDFCFGLQGADNGFYPAGLFAADL